MSILVLGLGNIIMTDDGLGGRAVETLRARFTFSEEMRIEDGGTLGLDLLPMFEGVDKLLIIDALEMDAAPGTLFRLEGEEVPRALASKVSVHQMGIQDLLAVAELQGHLPGELVVWGVQPQTVEMGIHLSPQVAERVEEMLDGIINELRAWGVEVVPQVAAEA